LNEIIKNQEEHIEVLQLKLETQENMMNMVVHDMRNPSEAINNGLNQAQ
jgi:hypothetical protein